MIRLLSFPRIPFLLILTLFASTLSGCAGNCGKKTAAAPELAPVTQTTLTADTAPNRAEIVPAQAEQPRRKAANAQKTRRAKVKLGSYTDTLGHLISRQPAAEAKAQPVARQPFTLATKAQPKYNVTLANQEWGIRNKLQQLNDEGRLPQSRMRSYADLLGDLLPQKTMIAQAPAKGIKATAMNTAVKVSTMSPAGSAVQAFVSHVPYAPSDSVILSG